MKKIERKEKANEREKKEYNNNKKCQCEWIIHLE